MNSFFRNNKMTLALLAGVLIGGACGVIFGDSVHVVKPVGDIFLNLVFMLVVPLVFFSIASSLCKMSGTGMLGKVLGVTAAVFIAMSVVAGIITYLSTLVVNPLGNIDRSALEGSLFDVSGAQKVATSEAIVNMVTVSDFNMLFTKSNLLPLIIFSALLGLAVPKAGAKGRHVASFLESGTEVTMQIMKYIMYLAPVGLGCFFADIIASVGPQILSGYIRVFLLYLAVTVIFFFGIHSVYALMAGGREGLKLYWKNIMPPSLVALATTSSIAAIPGNIEAAKNMGVSEGIAETVIPLGTNLHKDGSVVGGVMKVIFLMILCGQATTGVGVCFEAVLIAILSGVVIGAIPSGGLTGEILVCTLMGLDPQMAGIIIVIGTIVDMPASMLNSSANVAAAMLINRFTSKKKD